MIHKTIYELKESHRDLIVSFIEVWTERYPKAVENKRKRYQAYQKNKWHYEFLIVRGLIKCNLGGNDNRMDIDSEGNFHFEYTMCPLAGECFEWKESCEPKENLEISPAEERVLKLIAQGKTVDEIAVILCRSRFTIENQTNNMLRKRGVHNNAALVDYYHKHSTHSDE